MIAIGTNVLLRYLLQDDVAQAEKAANVINSNMAVLISNVVLVETLLSALPVLPPDQPEDAVYANVCNELA